MSQQTTEQLIAALAGAVEPVRPIPRLRSIAAGVLLAFAGASAGLLAVGGGTGELLASIPWANPRFVLVLIGLGLTAAFLLSSLASVVPGRGGVERGGRIVALVGIALALAGGVWAAQQWPVRLAADLATSASCIGKSAALALLPLAVVLVFLARGLVRQPLLTAGPGVIGTVALAGVMIHLSCRCQGALHVLVGHAMAPLIVGAALAIPAGWLIVRAQRRS